MKRVIAWNFGKEQVFCIITQLFGKSGPDTKIESWHWLGRVKSDQLLHLLLELPDQVLNTTASTHMLAMPWQGVNIQGKDVIFGIIVQLFSDCY